MATISVRISDNEKKQLMKYGTLSESLREGLRLYLSQRKSEEVLRKLEELQVKNPIKTTTIDDGRLIREDRRR